MIFVDATGLSVAVSTCSLHESWLIRELFGFMLSAEFPARIIGGKAYESDPVDAALATKGIEMITPNLCNRKQTQDGCPLRQHCCCWSMEQTFPDSKTTTDSASAGKNSNLL